MHPESNNKFTMQQIIQFSIVSVLLVNIINIKIVHNKWTSRWVRNTESQWMCLKKYGWSKLKFVFPLLLDGEKKVDWGNGRRKFKMHFINSKDLIIFPVVYMGLKLDLSF
jgi:hypothetical protein